MNPPGLPPRMCLKCARRARKMLKLPNIFQLPAQKNILKIGYLADFVKSLLDPEI